MTGQNSIVIEEISDSQELAKARERREYFDRNSAYFQLYSRDIYRKYRGKCVLIAGEELYAADTPEEAWEIAERVHPEDSGKFVQYIPKQKVIRLYGNWR